MYIFLPTGAFSVDTFFKPRTPTDRAKMSHRSVRESDKERALVSEGHWLGNLTIPRPLPPCQDINSHKSEKITMHECKKHDQE